MSTVTQKTNETANEGGTGWLIKFKLACEEQPKYVRVNQNQQVWELKEMIHKQTGLSPSKQTLYITSSTSPFPRPLVSSKSLLFYFPSEQKTENSTVIVEHGLLGGWCVCFIDGCPCCCP